MYSLYGSKSIAHSFYWVGLKSSRLPSLGIHQAFVEEESELLARSGNINRTTRLQGLHPDTHHFVPKQRWLFLEPLELVKLLPEIVTIAKNIITKSRVLSLSRTKENFAKKRKKHYAG